MPAVPESELGFFRLLAPEILFAQEGETLCVGTLGHEREISIRAEDGRWTVCTEDWHGHYDGSEAALHASVSILSGESRTVQEFRGDILASNWLEVYDGEAFAVEHVSLYLNPFDAEDWTNEPGDAWVARRKHRRLLRADPDIVPWGTKGLCVQLGQVAEWVEPEQRASEHYRKSPTFSWLELDYGPPEAEMRWTTDKKYRLVFQAPKGWRQDRLDPDEGTTFAAPHRELCLRVRTYFRDSEKPLEEELKSPVLPSSIEYCFEPQLEGDSKWERHRWDVIFSTGKEDMLAQLSLFRLRGGHDASPYRDLLDKTLHFSRYRFA